MLSLSSITWRPGTLLAGLFLFISLNIRALATDIITLPNAIRAFAVSALQLEEGAHAVPASYLVRWTGPVYVTLTPDAERARTQIQHVMEQYGAAARISVLFLPAGDSRANFRFTASPKSACRTELLYTDLYMISVDVHLDLAGRRDERCISHEALHGFGFRSHLHAFPSILSYNYRSLRGASELDLLLLRTLYDPRLIHGMPRRQALHVACLVLAEKLASSQQEIDQACSAS